MPIDPRQMRDQNQRIITVVPRQVPMETANPQDARPRRELSEAMKRAHRFMRLLTGLLLLTVLALASVTLLLALLKYFYEILRKVYGF